MNEWLMAAAERYRPQGRMVYGFARGKLLNDPVYAAVLPFVAQDAKTLLDVGCAEGYLLSLLHEARPNLMLHGFDHDERRVGIARTALQEHGVALHIGDARAHAMAPADVVTCLDVLHYQSPDDQDAMLGRLASALRPGGLLLVRDLEPGTGLFSWTAQMAERIAVAWGRHQGDGVFPRPAEQTKAAMERAGLEVKMVPCDEGTPFANMLFVGKRVVA